MLARQEKAHLHSLRTGALRSDGMICY
jgi:hypothetical protein